MLLFKATCIAFSVCFIGSCISWESNPWPWRSAVWAKEECGRKLALIMLVLLHRSIKEPAPLHLSNLISTLLKKWNDNRLCCLLNVWRHEALRAFSLKPNRTSASWIQSSPCLCMCRVPSSFLTSISVYQAPCAAVWKRISDRSGLGWIITALSL